MAISDKLTQLRQIRDSIRTAIVNRGGTLPEGTSMESYSDAITNIPRDAKLTGVVSLRYIGSGSSFVSGLESIDYSTVTNMSYMFHEYLGTTVDLSSLDTSKVTTMTYMFRNCFNLTTVDLSSLDTSKVTNMSFMFENCYDLTTVDLSGLDTSNVTVMSRMFSACSNLTTLDLSSLDTSKVTNMTYMFANCSNLTTVYVKDQDAYNKFTTLPTWTPSQVQFIIK